jgi:hypothetical protein
LLELLFFIKLKNNLIPVSNISKLSDNVVSQYFIKNSYVLQDKRFNKDIYDIKFSNYFSKKQIIDYIESNVNIKNEIKEESKKETFKKVEKIYYKLIKKNTKESILEAEKIMKELTV